MSEKHLLAVPVKEIVRALEREAANTDTDYRWLAAAALRNISQWEGRTIVCLVDTDPPPRIEGNPSAHALVNDTLEGTSKGIIARCVCGWTSGHRITSLTAYGAMMDHLEKVAAEEQRPTEGDGG